MRNILIITLLLLLGFSSCTDDDDHKNPIHCDFETVINSDQYMNAPSDLLTIIRLEIAGDCLKIEFSSSGCSGDSWDIKLIDSEDILKSNPPQRNLRLSLKNEELCQAIFTKALTFDISKLQLDGDTVRLNITNSGDSILYHY